LSRRWSSGRWLRIGVIRDRITPLSGSVAVSRDKAITIAIAGTSRICQEGGWWQR